MGHQSCIEVSAAEKVFLGLGRGLREICLIYLSLHLEGIIIINT